jgi:hypothetical protein
MAHCCRNYCVLLLGAALALIVASQSYADSAAADGSTISFATDFDFANGTASDSAKSLPSGGDFIDQRAATSAQEYHHSIPLALELIVVVVCTFRLGRGMD